MSAPSVIEEKWLARPLGALRKTEEDGKAESSGRLHVGRRLWGPSLPQSLQFLVRVQAESVCEHIELSNKLIHSTHPRWLPGKPRRFKHGRPILDRKPPLNPRKQSRVRGR